MARFKFVVSGSHLDLISPTKIVADWINATSMVFEFRSQEWQGADKWVHLSNPDYYDGQVFDINLIDDEISEDRQLSLAPGVWEIYLHGTKLDDQGNIYQRFVTDTKNFQVVSSGVVNNNPLPIIEPSAAEQIDEKATAALNARIVSATAEVDSGVGVPSVEAEINGEDREKNIHLSFHNLKGNGISNMSFVESGPDVGELTVTYDNGQTQEFDAIKNAIQYMGDELDQHIEDELEEIKKDFTPSDGVFITPQQYGAKGDGLADDTEALSLAFNRSNAVIEGSNKSYKLLELTMTECENLVIQNFRFYHGICITLKHCTNILFRNCVWDEFQDNGIPNKNVWGVLLTTIHTGSDEWVEENNWRMDEVCKNITFDGCTFLGTHFTESTPSLYVNNKPHYNTGEDLRLEGVDGLYIRHCYFTQNRGNACIHQNCYAPFGDFELTDNFFYLNCWGGFSLYRCTAVGSYPTRLIQGNRFIGHGLGYLPWSYLELFDEKDRGVGTAALYVANMSRMRNEPPHFVVMDNYFEDNNESSIEGWYFNPIKNNVIIGNGALQSEESVEELTEKYHVSYPLYVRKNPSQNPIYCDRTSSAPPYPAGEDRVIENNTIARTFGTRNPIMIRGVYHEPLIVRNNTFSEEALYTDINYKFAMILKADFYQGLVWENNLGMQPYFNECNFIGGKFLIDDMQDMYKCTFSTQAFESISKVERFQQIKQARFSTDYATLRDNQVSTVVDGKPTLGSYKYPHAVVIPDADWDIKDETEYGEDGYVFGGADDPTILDTELALGATDQNWTIYVDTTTTGDNSAGDHSYLIKLLTFSAADGTTSLEIGSRFSGDAWTWIFPNAVWSYDNTYRVDQGSSHNYLKAGYSSNFVLRHKAGSGKIEVFAKREAAAIPASLDDIKCGSWDFTSGTAGTLRFGGQPNTDKPLSYYNGKIKDARVFERYLSDAQVSMIMLGTDITPQTDPVPVYDIADDPLYVEGTGVTFDGTFAIDTDIPILENTNDFTIVSTFKFDSMRGEGGKPNFSFYPVFSAMSADMPSQVHTGYTDKGFDVGLSMQYGMSLEDTAAGGFLTFRRDWRYVNGFMIDSANYFNYPNITYTVVVVRKDNVIKVYDQNLVELKSMSGDYATTILQGNLTIGAKMGYDSSYTNFFKGVISEFQVFDSAIDLSYIEAKHPSIEDNDASLKGAVTYNLWNNDWNRKSVRYALVDINYDLGEYNSAEYTSLYPKAFGIKLDKIYDDVVWVPCSGSHRITFTKLCKWDAVYDSYKAWNLEIVNPGTVPNMTVTIKGIRILLLSKQEDIPDTVDATDFTVTWDTDLDDLEVGDTATGFAQFVPDDATVGTTLTVTSEDTNVAQVAVSGQSVTVTAIGPGETVVHVSIPYGTEHTYGVTITEAT